MTLVTAVDRSTTADTAVDLVGVLVGIHAWTVIPPRLWPTSTAFRPTGTVAASTDSRSWGQDGRVGRARPILDLAVAALVVGDECALAEEGD